MADPNLKRSRLAVVSQLQLLPFLYSELPTSPEPSTIVYVTDSNTAVIGDVIAGGGTDQILAVYGTDWTVFAVLT